MTWGFPGISGQSPEDRSSPRSTEHLLSPFDPPPTTRLAFSPPTGRPVKRLPEAALVPPRPKMVLRIPLLGDHQREVLGHELTGMAGVADVDGDVVGAVAERGP